MHLKSIPHTCYWSVKTYGQPVSMLLQFVIVPILHFPVRSKNCSPHAPKNSYYFALPNSTTQLGCRKISFWYTNNDDNMGMLQIWRQLIQQKAKEQHSRYHRNMRVRCTSCKTLCHLKCKLMNDFWKYSYKCKHIMQINSSHSSMATNINGFCWKS